MKKQITISTLLLGFITILSLSCCSSVEYDALDDPIGDSLAFAEFGMQQPLKIDNGNSCYSVTLKKKYGIYYEEALRNIPAIIEKFQVLDYGVGWHPYKVTKYWVYFRLNRADELGWE